LVVNEKGNFKEENFSKGLLIINDEYDLDKKYFIRN
jgi:hypothetical protein